MESFIDSQFGYCPLIWMHECSLRMYLHEHSLCIAYKDNNSSFKELLQSLPIEVLKVKENLSTTIMNNILQTRTLTYNLRLQTDFARNFVNTSHFELNSPCYFASKVWNIVPLDIKNARNLHIFKNKIRKWEPKECHCDLC